MAENGRQWPKMGENWPEMAKNRRKWPENGRKWAQKWTKMAENGQKWPKNGRKWPTMAKTGRKMGKNGQHWPTGVHGPRMGSLQRQHRPVLQFRTLWTLAPPICTLAVHKCSIFWTVFCLLTSLFSDFLRVFGGCAPLFGVLKQPPEWPKWLTVAQNRKK